MSDSSSIDAGDGGQATLPLAEKPNADEAKLKAAQARLATLEANEEERELLAKRKAEEKRVKDEGASVVLVEKSKALEEAEARLKVFEERETARIEAQIEALPEAAQKRVAVIRGALSTEQLAAYLEQEEQAMPESGGRSDGMVTGDVGIGRGGVKSSGLRVSAQAADILEQYAPGIDHRETAKRMRETVERDEKTGERAHKFMAASFQDLRSMMPKAVPQIITLRSIADKFATG